MNSVLTAPAHDLAAVKARQQATWASGNFSRVAAMIVLTAERLAEAADLRAGWRVLDVACGSGNAAIAAARHGTRALGIDYVPALLEDARLRAAAEGLDVEFRLGDAEALPAPDDTFDAVLSVYGSMFAPDHRRTAAEIVRVARPGARVALASWCPDGFIGEMFRVITRHVPPPAGLTSPLAWGTPDHLADLFGDAALEMRSTVQVQAFRAESAQAFVDFFRTWYGPTRMAFQQLGPGQQQLNDDLVALASDWDRNSDGGAVTIPGTYLETVIALR